MGTLTEMYNHTKRQDDKVLMQVNSGTYIISFNPGSIIHYELVTQPPCAASVYAYIKWEQRCGRIQWVYKYRKPWVAVIL